MTAGNLVPEAFAQPWAFDGTPSGRDLTKQDLTEILGGLEAFTRILRQRQESHKVQSPQKNGEEDRPGRIVDEVVGSDGLATEHAVESEPQLKTDASSPAGGSTEPGVHCLVVAGYLGPGHGMNPKRRTEHAVADACKAYFQVFPDAGTKDYPMRPRVNTIHVILDSPGGSLDSAYRMVLYLRRFAKTIQVWVPNRAKSAGSLVAIGADTIVMSPFAELGPLDTQIRDPRNPSQDISALDCYLSVDYVRDFGISTVSRALRTLLSETHTMIPLTDLVATATQFAVGSVEPMFGQVKALDFGAWGRTLRVGETYAKSLRLRLQHPDAAEAAERLAKKLVYGYTHHPYPIDVVEARDLELKVDVMHEDLHSAALRIADACKDARFVGFADDAQAALDTFSEKRRDGQLRTTAVSRAYGGTNEDEPAARVVDEPERMGRRPVDEPERMGNRQ